MTTTGFAHGRIDPSWDEEFESLAFTAEALFAHPDPDDQDLGRIGARVRGLLGDWEEIDAAGRGLRRAAIHASARVRAADSALDYALAQFAGDLLAEIKQDRAQPLYERLFHEPHEDIIDSGLDVELPAATLVVYTLDQDESLPGALRRHREALRAAVQMGNGALVQRSDVLAELGRHQARMEAWKESAVGMHRNVYRGIARFAAERKLSARWVQGFFLRPVGVD